VAEATYDLAGPAGDYPAWVGPPKRTVVVCSHMRSGSTLLGEALRAAGLGTPLEYYHRGFRPTLQARWGAASLAEYAQAVHRHRTAPSGVHGLKLFWADVEDIAHERDPAAHPPAGERTPSAASADDYRHIFALIADLAPDPAFVHLRRRDRIRQAVSHHLASRTGVWRAIDGQESAASGAAEYDYERIRRLVAYAAGAHAHWHGFFAAIGARPHAITYEQLERDFAGTVGDLLNRLGAPAPSLAAPRTRPQWDAASEAMALRFAKEDAARGG
jgi:trehalose 2-sulfotransferase